MEIKILRTTDEFYQLAKLLEQLTVVDIPKTSIYNLAYVWKYRTHPYYSILAKDGDKVVGALTLFIEMKLIHEARGLAHIEDVVVDKDYRKQGICKKMMDYAEQIAKSINCYRIVLSCKPENIPVYESSGFKTSGQVEMRKEL